MGIKVPEVKAVDVAKNVRDLFNAATPEDIAAGVSWYRDNAERIADKAIALGFNPETGFAVAAVLSPGMDWTSNLRYALEMLEDFRRDGTIIDNGKAYSCMNYDTVRKANGLMLTDSKSPLDATYHTPGNHQRKAGDYAALSGRKVSSFYRNFAGEYGVESGDSNAATLDAHMGRAVMGDPNRLYKNSGFPTNGAGAYAHCEPILQQVAAEFGLKTCELQAVVWLVVRRFANATNK